MQNYKEVFIFTIYPPYRQPSPYTPHALHNSDISFVIHIVMGCVSILEIYQEHNLHKCHKHVFKIHFVFNTVIILKTMWIYTWIWTYFTHELGNHCILLVVIGRSLLIYSDVTFKMAAWRPYLIFWFPDSNFSLALNINSKLQWQTTYVYG